jgi:hypothetical protein
MTLALCLALALIVRRIRHDRRELQELRCKVLMQEARGRMLRASIRSRQQQIRALKRQEQTHALKRQLWEDE